MKEGESIEARTLVSFMCPFCGRQASAVEEIDSKQPSVLHETPTCGVFDRSDAVTYMQAVNRVAADRRGVGLA